LERKDNGLFALHLKSGYDKKPNSLTVTETAGDKTVGTWKINDVPAPKLVLPDGALTGTPLGSVQLVSGRGGRIGASVHLTMPLAKDEGVILKPIAASYTPIDTPADSPGIVSKAGESPFDGRFNLPNAKMARRVSFDMITYQGVTTTETVTLKSIDIESAFGQPYLSVKSQETETAPSGIKLIAEVQGFAPRRAPRKIYNDVALQVSLDAGALKGDSVPGVAPGITAELVSPTPASLGLSNLRVTSMLVTPSEGENVFGAPASSRLPVADANATVKTGLVGPMTFRITVVRPKIVSTKRIVLPVDPKLIEGGAGGGGGRASASPRAA